MGHTFVTKTLRGFLVSLGGLVAVLTAAIKRILAN